MQQTPRINQQNGTMNSNYSSKNETLANYYSTETRKDTPSDHQKSSSNFISIRHSVPVNNIENERQGSQKVVSYPIS